VDTTIAAFHSFAHLCVKIAIRWITFLGTSPGGIATQLLLVFVTEARSGWLRWSAWTQNWQGGLRRGLYALLAVWAFTFLVCTITTVYDDHRLLVQSNASLREEIKNLSVKREPPSAPAIAYVYRNEMSIPQVANLAEHFAGAIRQAKPIVFLITFAAGNGKFNDDIIGLIVHACDMVGGSPCTLRVNKGQRFGVGRRHCGRKPHDDKTVSQTWQITPR
jgi:hypothetical protein